MNKRIMREEKDIMRKDELHSFFFFSPLKRKETRKYLKKQLCCSDLNTLLLQSQHSSSWW